MKNISGQITIKKNQDKKEFLTKLGRAIEDLAQLQFFNLSEFERFYFANDIKETVKNLATFYEHSLSITQNDNEVYIVRRTAERKERRKHLKTQTILYCSIVTWFKENIKQYISLNDENWIHHVCEQLEISEADYKEIMML